MKQPSAYLPLAMSLAALALVLGHAAMFGIVHEADEGAAAHIFQILMAAQIPVVAYFAIKWQDRHCVYLQCKPRPGSQHLPPSFFSPSGELRQFQPPQFTSIRSYGRQ
jgi:hypothetical protein